MIDNRQDFSELVKRYETITLKEIEDAMPLSLFSGGVAAKHLTDFGTLNWTLCKTAAILYQIETGDNIYFSPPLICEYCFYNSEFGCQEEGENENSYNRILDAKTPEELLEAFRERAKLMRRKYL